MIPKASVTRKSTTGHCAMYQTHFSPVPNTPPAARCEAAAGPATSSAMAAVIRADVITVIKTASGLVIHHGRVSLVSKTALRPPITAATPAEADQSAPRMLKAAL